jgi:DNA-binding MarR family transcriptional regulator
MTDQGFKENEESIHQNMYECLLSTSRWLEDNANETFKPLGTTPQQYNVLQILRNQHPESCTATYLKETMAEKNPDLTRLIDRLVKKGMVTRKVCSNNRRKIDIGITPKGLSMLTVVAPLVNEQFKILNKISPNEAAELCRILDKLRS